MNSFNSYTKGLDLSLLRTYCNEHGRRVQYNRNCQLVKEGETSRYIGLVERGFFKYMVRNVTEQKDFITGFAFAGEFVGDFPNCLHHRPANVSIVAGTSCEVCLIDGEDLRRLFDTDPKMKNLEQTVFNHLFAQVYSQYLESYRMTSRERYNNLLQRCPEIVQKINLKDIASYLRVTPTTISNIRRELTFAQ